MPKSNEPYIHLQPDETIGTAECGCRLDASSDRDDPAMYLCPMHEVAPDSLGVVKQFIRYCEQWQRMNGEFCKGDGRSLILVNARKVIAKQGGIDADNDPA